MVFFFLATHRSRLCSYNVCNLAQIGRTEEISMALEACDIIGIRYTGCRVLDTKREYWKRRVNEHTLVHFGWVKKAKYVNKSCRCAIFINNKYDIRHIKNVELPSPDLRGRGGQVCLVSSGIDIAPGVAYFPPPHQCGVDEQKLV